MASTIKIKNSSTASAAPLVGDLVEAELAINTTDKRIYTRNNASAVVRLDGGQYTITAGTGLTGTDTVENEPTLAFDTTWGDARYAAIAGSNWATARTLTATGDATGVTAAFDGSGDITLSLTVVGGDVDTATTAGTLTGLTATVTELNYTDGVTSAIQTQLDAKSPIASPTFTGTLTSSGAAVFGAEIVEEVYALSGTTPALNPANGTIQTWTLSANSTPTDSLAAGESITLMVDDGTAYTVTWPTMTWVGGSAPTLPTSGYAVITLWKVGSTLYGNHAGDA